MWVYDEAEKKIVQREISYVPGLYKVFIFILLSSLVKFIFKVFDEILVNAADNKQRDPKMNLIKVKIDKYVNCILALIPIILLIQGQKTKFLF